MDAQFWEYLDELIGKSSIVIDRLRGSFHPNNSDVVYPLDYGYLEDTVTVDGSGIDIWIGTSGDRRPDATVCTVDLEKLDIEIKVLLSCSETDINTIMKFHNSGSMRAILVRRKD